MLTSCRGSLTVSAVSAKRSIPLPLGGFGILAETVEETGSTETSLSMRARLVSVGLSYHNFCHDHVAEINVRVDWTENGKHRLVQYERLNHCNRDD